MDWQQAIHTQKNVYPDFIENPRNKFYSYKLIIVGKSK